MIKHLMENAQTYVHTNPWLALVAVFLGGLLTASNPCVLAMIPLTIGFVSGGKSVNSAKSAFLFSLFFILGLSVMFTDSFSLLELVGGRGLPPHGPPFDGADYCSHPAGQR